MLNVEGQRIFMRGVRLNLINLRLRRSKPDKGMIVKHWQSSDINYGR